MENSWKFNYRFLVESELENKELYCDPNSLFLSYFPSLWLKKAYKTAVFEGIQLQKLSVGIY